MCLRHLWFPCAIGPTALRTVVEIAVTFWVIRMTYFALVKLFSECFLYFLANYLSKICPFAFLLIWMFLIKKLSSLSSLTICLHLDWIWQCHCHLSTEKKQLVATYSRWERYSVPLFILILFFEFLSLKKVTTSMPTVTSQMPNSCHIQSLHVNRGHVHGEMLKANYFLQHIFCYVNSLHTNNNMPVPWYDLEPPSPPPIPYLQQ